jgi:hypothetical protein
MSDINFQPMFDYIDEHVDGQIKQLRTEMATKADIERILQAIDAFTKQSKDNNTETVVLKAKTERIEHWVIKAAEKTDIPYNP